MRCAARSNHGYLFIFGFSLFFAATVVTFGFFFSPSGIHTRHENDRRWGCATELVHHANCASAHCAAATTRPGEESGTLRDFQGRREPVSLDE